MKYLRLKSFKKLIPYYLILFVAFRMSIVELMLGSQAETDLIMYSSILAVSSFLLIALTVYVFRGSCQKDINRMKATGEFGSNDDMALERIEHFLDTSTKICDVHYDENYVLGWHEWTTTFFKRADIYNVTISRNVYHYKIVIPIMCDYTISFVLRNGTVKQIKAATKRRAIKIVDALGYYYEDAC